ncbi:Interleukin-1 receptor-associated kinase-like 2, partial [Galemys pyrenaicus]
AAATCSGCDRAARRSPCAGRPCSLDASSRSPCCPNSSSALGPGARAPAEPPQWPRRLWPVPPAPGPRGRSLPLRRRLEGNWVLTPLCALLCSLHEGLEVTRVSATCCLATCERGSHLGRTCKAVWPPWNAGPEPARASLLPPCEDAPRSLKTPPSDSKPFGGLGRERGEKAGGSPSLLRVAGWEAGGAAGSSSVSSCFVCASVRSLTTLRLLCARFREGKWWEQRSVQSPPASPRRPCARFPGACRTQAPDPAWPCPVDGPSSPQLWCSRSPRGTGRTSPCWFHPHPVSSLESQNVSASCPQLDALQSLSEDVLFWREADVVQATDNFSQQHKVCEGTFADIYRGQRHGTPLIFKKLREMTSGPGSVAKFFQAEVQLCRRCRHPNVLALLGFCTGKQFYSLIYPYMANGSLQDRLQRQGDTDPLSWPQRVQVCSGLLQAVAHLHGLDLVHGNVKSSNVLLDQNFAPKLAHPVAHLRPVRRGPGCSATRTRLFQAAVAYLPEDCLRVGQLGRRGDIFGCGIVLAEVLTGIPAADGSRSPVYLKDLLLGTVPSGTPSLCSRKTGVERVMAKEICLRYLEKRAGHLREDCAEALATAACLCLQRRNASLAEVCGWVAMAEERLCSQGASLPGSGLSEGSGLSSNTPEETDDVDLSSLRASSSGTAPSPPRMEGGETGAGDRRAQAAGGAEADTAEACASARSPKDETSWKIEINEAKRTLMENILLYEEDKLDSSELFGP